MSIIAYNQNIPQSTDQISQSQPLILQNFQGINTLIGIDHATFASGNAGFHNKVTLPDQTASLPVFTGTNAGMYAKLLGSKNEIYSHTENFSSDVPFTKSTVSTTGSNTSGYFYLPCGLIVCMSNNASTGTSGTTITYSTAVSGFPGFKVGSIPLVFVTPISGSVVNNAVVNVTISSATTFTAYGVNMSGVGTNVFYNWIAVGQSTSL